MSKLMHRKAACYKAGRDFHNAALITQPASLLSAITVTQDIFWSHLAEKEHRIAQVRQLTL
jgi:hypothetical protein